jgi:DNA-directed RNA polymerase beta' subunit
MFDALACRALGLLRPLAHLALAPLDLDTLRIRAPGVVRSLVTYDRHTTRPAPGGLFDEEIFGAGASLVLPRAAEDDTILRERATRFGRIVLSESVPHPWQGEVTIAELPVLPPDLRPIVYRDGEFLMSALNVGYREVLAQSGRLGKLRDVRAPLAVLAETRAALTNAVAALFDHERRAEPARHETGRALVSVRALLRPDASTALAALDEAVGRGVDPSAPMPLRLHRIVAALFALGLVVRRVGDLAPDDVGKRS